MHSFWHRLLSFCSTISNQSIPNNKWNLRLSACTNQINCVQYWFPTYVYWITWDVVIAYLSCFNKILVEGLLTIVLYSSGRTGKLERGKSLSSLFKGSGVCSFPLEEITLYQAIQILLCNPPQCSIWAQYFQLIAFLFFFPLKILVYKPQEKKMYIRWEEVSAKMYDYGVNHIPLRAAGGAWVGFMIPHLLPDLNAHTHPTIYQSQLLHFTA